MRYEILADSLPFDLEGFRGRFFPIAAEFGMNGYITDSDAPTTRGAAGKQRIALPVRSPAPLAQRRSALRHSLRDLQYVPIPVAKQNKARAFAAVQPRLGHHQRTRHGHAHWNKPQSSK